jgi:legumain
VTTENYIGILTGNSTAIKGGNGRVLTSNAEDTVFLNFVDHGEPGIIDFPEIGEWPESKT